jgi:hypothetical protein
MLGSQALAGKLHHSGQRLRLMVSLEMLGYTSPAQNYPLPAMRRLYGQKRVRPVLVGSRNHPWRQHGDSMATVLSTSPCCCGHGNPGGNTRV